MMQKLIRGAAVAAALFGLGACKLDVSNPNAGDTQQVISAPVDVESLVAAYYKRWHSGMYSTTTNVWGMANVMSFEDFSTLSNNCMGQRISIPRAANDNSIGNGCSGEQQTVYQREEEVVRVASTVLNTLDQPGFTLGSPARDNRTRAFGQFLRGLSLGYLAMTYDSAAVVDETMTTQDIGVLAGYQDVMKAALDALQQAITLATPASATAADGFPLPPTWIPSSNTFTAAEFIKLAHSYRARFAADVARTPAERAAVNWAGVIADAQAGITADHDNITNTVSGPSNTWVSQWFVGSGNNNTWHAMTPFVIGMADNSGSYAAWIAQALGDRGNTGSFHMTTPDLRFPQGGTRAQQQADFAISSCNGASQTCKRYFVNRATGADPSFQIGWGASEYDHARFISWVISGAGTARNGPFPFFTLAENNMLAAEGMIRTGNFAGAAALVNLTRVKNGLPAITAFDNTTPVPGGADCVPKVPVGPNFNTIACGNLMEAMKYEKRMEEAYTHFMGWFLDERGWGDLPAGTPLHWAVPYQDLQARGRPLSAIYSTGGSANPTSAAAKGTYGW